MMRTPAKTSKSVVRNASQIGKTPSQSTRRRLLNLRAFSSDQMTSILHNHSIGPTNNLKTCERKENVTLGELVVERKDLATDVERKDLAIDVERKENVGIVKVLNNTPNNVYPTEPISKGDFCEKFCGWLKKTERDFDAADFTRLRRDLLQVVGNYTLDLSKK